jgi:hypothetical protein
MKDSKIIRVSSGDKLLITTNDKCSLMDIQNVLVHFQKSLPDSIEAIVVPGNMIESMDVLKVPKGEKSYGYFY